MAEPCRIDVFCCPKAGNSVDEYEDAWSFRTVDAGRYRCAVADGATESSFSRLWATLLVGGYTRILRSNVLLEYRPIKAL